MLSKTYYVAYMEKPIANNFQNFYTSCGTIEKSIVRVNKSTITLPIEMEGSTIIDIEM